MLYERSRKIENRLQTALRLIKTGRYSTPELADEIGVSIPTISRAVTALRQRGYKISAERATSGWRYRLEPAANENRGSKKQSRRRPR